MAQSKKRKLPPNPKDIFGLVKTPLNLVPSVGTAWTAAAFADGAIKYGAFNWRENSVQADIYIAAAKRHMDLWFEGQRLAPDSGVHHLGHASACIQILLDAEANDNLIDNRPIPGEEALDAVFAEIKTNLEAKAKARTKKGRK